jgi:NADH dehydrogenase (ubiquinone) 1 alpha subcomplex subunit 13
MYFVIVSLVSTIESFRLLRRFVRERNKLLEEEAKVMANVPGWKVGENVYNSGRWMPPSSGKLGIDS